MTFSNYIKRDWLVLLGVIIPFIVSALIWDIVPDTVPTHYDITGEPDAYGPKWMLLILIPAINIFTYLTLLVVPYIDPKSKIKAEQRAIKGIRLITIFFFDVVYAVTIAVALDYDVDISTFILVAVGLLFFIIGNYMNSVKPNYFIGIRTPWTLENETVWKKTHRLSSKLWMIGGLLFCFIPLFIDMEDYGFIFIILTTILLAFIPITYSFIIFNQIKKTS